MAAAKGAVMGKKIEFKAWVVCRNSAGEIVLEPDSDNPPIDPGVHYRVTMEPVEPELKPRDWRNA